MVIENPAVLRRTVEELPKQEQAPFGNFVMWLASIADDLQPWGGSQMNFKARDIQLRQFWMQEAVLASALYTITIRDSAFSWTIKGDAPKTVQATQTMLHNADLGKGWLDFIQKWRLDFLTQDNGAFFETIRQADSADSPVIGINHLDAGRCRRTGVVEWPVIYTDRKGGEHKMKPYQIVMSSDFPSPIVTVNGVGVCAVTRVLRQAQFMRDLGIRDRERSSGMDPKSIHLISGVNRAEIENVLNVHKDQQIEQGLVRYNKPVIFAGIDPDKPATATTLDLAPKPDQWDFDVQMRWYISLLAMALGVDYQDLAPLPGRGIGGSQQSLILHEKSKGKGPELFMKTIEHIFNFHGIIPSNVTFEYNEKDPAGEQEAADLFKAYSEAGEKYVSSGILSDQGVRNIMLDEGLISQEIYDLESAGSVDATDEVVADDDKRPIQQPGSQSANVKPEGEKAEDELAPFAEEERLVWEEDMFDDINRGLKKLFRDLRKKILPRKALTVEIGEKGDPVIATGDKFLREFRLVMTGAMAPNARQIYLGAGEFNQSIGLAVNMDAMNLSVFEFTRDYTTTWLAEVERTTSEGLRQAILTWQESGLGKQGLPDLVKSIEPLFGEARAQRIAATETTRVFDLGNKAAHTTAGIEFEQWQTAMDDLVRPEHEALQGQVFPLDQGPRPSDFINCRCARVPIATPEAEAIGVTV
jgi:SPP1 gp7 family putative phage head morphogenesis protein|tara:strand:+ start:2797 stop:4890 length:2094 start_codon:yes stop_codon:yes gene_type:complete